MTALEILDNIILSQNVVDDFYSTWNNNIEFRDWILQNIPELEDCEKQQQNNPWHKYNVLGHILHSVEEMNKQTESLDINIRRMLAYVMLFHDIGKPLHHIERIKDGVTIDSFYNHNIGSEKIARRVLPLLNFDQNTIDIICKLVYKHDIFMFIRDFPTNNPHWRTLTPRLIKEEIHDLNSVGEGKTLMKYLIMVGRSDNLAQNEKMTADSLKMLDKMENMLNNLQ